MQGFEAYPSAAPVTEAEVEQARRYREPAEFGLERAPFESALPKDSDKVTDPQIADQISKDAYELLIAFEVTSREVYARKYKQPEWPQGQSGITIGLGFDTGYHTHAEFEKAWKDQLPDDHFKRLDETVGFNTAEGHADRGSRVARARQWVRQLSDIEVAWDKAEQAYRRSTVPKYGRLTIDAFPNAMLLHPDCFGALFSLVYNRGPGMGPGDRRREMRNIREHMKEKRFELIPAELRAMKRIWEGELEGLVKRREQEARLFEQGLSAQSVLMAQAPAAASPDGRMVQAESYERATGGGIDSDLRGFVEDLSTGPEPAGRVLESTSWDGVQWPTNDEDSPEYRHILPAQRPLAKTTFEFGAKELELLIRANGFDPTRANKRIIFALRGAQMVANATATEREDKQVDRDKLMLRELRPDHRDFRCVIGAYNLETGKLSGFLASTVPGAKNVWKYQTDQIAGCNMVPSGCYRYTVGRHNPSGSNVPGCLIENGASKCVLRTKNDLKYDTKDIFDPCTPGDNLHPAFRAEGSKFSSLGCQTIRGSGNSDGDITGEYAEFRAAMGFGEPGARADNGKQFDYVLVTGLEAAIASDLVKRGLDTDPATVQSQVGRIRQGSKGDAVRKLQAALGMTVSGDFNINTKKKFAEVQTAKLGWADGVYAPKMDEAAPTGLGMNIFTPPAPIVVVAVSPAATTATATTATTTGPTPAATPPAGQTNAPVGGSPLESARGMPGGAKPRTELESLYYELGARSRLARTNPDGFAESALPRAEFHEAFLGLTFDDVVNQGRRIFTRIEKSAHSLICGDEVADQGDRSQIQQALNGAAQQGVEQVIGVMSSILTMYLFLPTQIARTGAELIVKRVLMPVAREAGSQVMPKIEMGCRTWAVQLRQRQVGQQALSK